MKMEEAVTREAAGSRDENSSTPFSFQLTITGDDGNQTTIGQNADQSTDQSIKSSSLPVIEDEESAPTTFTIHNADPSEDPDEIVNMITGLSISGQSKPSINDNRPEWAHQSEERKRLDEIHKLEASLRDRAAEAQRMREQTEQSRMSQLQKEKEAAKMKLSHTQQSLTNQSTNQPTSRTELEIVAERVTNKNGEGEQDYWHQIY